MSLAPDLLHRDVDDKKVAGNGEKDWPLKCNRNGDFNSDSFHNDYQEINLIRKEEREDIYSLKNESPVQISCKENLHDSNNMRAFYKIASTLGLSQADTNTDPIWFYGVYLPQEVRLLDCGQVPVHVYTDKSEALKVMKQSKKARFKQFPTWKEAAEFAQNGSETTGNSCQAVGAEKPVPFKGPKPQDMIQFRKAIENGDLAAVKASIHENPRYLFSSGDTPSILQEGCRFNALHVAAKAKQADIAKLILNSVTSLDVLGRLFEDPDEAALKERSKVLLDLYLNTPDKSSNETPLHFAAKYGAVKVVELLTSYPECQRNLTNKFGVTVGDIVCTRVTDNSGILKKQILDLLEDKYYIPVLRYDDNSLQPHIGDTFSPVKPLVVTEDPLSPRVEMHAYAGPMTKELADHFRKKWRTPTSLLRASALPLADIEKGLECLGRDIASELKVPWLEYWSFLNTFVDLASSEGLQMLEKYLKRRFDETLHETVSPVSETGENGMHNVNKEEEVLSPISDLCQAFQSCSLQEGHRYVPSQHREKRRSTKDIDRKTWRKEKNLARKLEEATEHANDGWQQFSPILCVERSCQVFGKRIASMMYVKKCAETLKDNLGLDMEMKHLQALIIGYSQDPRFSPVDFRLVHTRVAAIAATTIRQLATPNELNMILNCLREIDMTDGTMSDDEDLLMSSREIEAKSLGAVLKTHVLCLTQCLIEELTEQGPSQSSVSSEAECEVLWSRACPCACAWDAHTHRARIALGRRHRLRPKILTFKSGDGDDSSIEESWRSCDEPSVAEIKEEDEDDGDGGDSSDDFKTPPLSPTIKEDAMEDSICIPDTFIYPGDLPSKTDIAVLNAIKGTHITLESLPSIYRWRHLVQLHERYVVPFGQVAPSPGAWHRRRLAPAQEPSVSKSPGRSCWQRVTGPYTPRRARNSPR